MSINFYLSKGSSLYFMCNVFTQGITLPYLSYPVGTAVVSMRTKKENANITNGTLNIPYIVLAKNTKSPNLSRGSSGNLRKYIKIVKPNTITKMIAS